MTRISMVVIIKIMAMMMSMPVTITGNDDNNNNDDRYTLGGKSDFRAWGEKLVLIAQLLHRGTICSIPLLTAC